MRSHPRRVVLAAWSGIVGVLVYVGSWWVAGLVRPGFAPATQAISELFELGSPWASRGPLLAGLVLSGVAMVVLAPVLDRSLPGGGRAGPVLVAVAGLGTLGVVVAPCSPGCPGLGASPTDTAHGLAAGIGYVALVAAPLAFGWRLRADAPGLARWSWTLGGVAAAGLVLRYSGMVAPVPGLQQRVFNTVADAWYLLAAVVVLRTTREPLGDGGRGRYEAAARTHPGAPRSRRARARASSRSS